MVCFRPKADICGFGVVLHYVNLMGRDLKRILKLLDLSDDEEITPSVRSAQHPMTHHRRRALTMGFRRMKKYLVVLMLSIRYFVGSAHAASVINGSMNVAGGVNVQTFNSVQPDDWDDYPDNSGTSTDIFDATTSFNDFTWVSSSDGGTFVHAVGPISGLPGEGILQEISGLTIGTTYQVNFEQSISWFNFPLGEGGHWEVVFGSETMQSAFMANPGSGVAFGWQDQTFQFTATAVTKNLSLQAVQPNINDRIGLGLDGVSISAVPIPAAAWLFGSALGRLGWMRRKAV